MKAPKSPRPAWMNMEVTLPDWFQPTALGMIACAAAWWIFLAMVLGWMSPDSAAQASAKDSQAAVVAYATPVCVAKFASQPNAVAVWHKLRSIKESYGWADFIEKENGLIGEPAQKLSPDTSAAIASGCAAEVLKLTSIGGVKLS
jgi:hypothetical protein